jgi:putative oxidoreductase
MTSRISGANAARFAPHALALLRIVAAALFLEHGLAKLVGFPAGAPPGEQPLMTLLGLAAVVETIAGTLLILGLFTRSVALIASGEMAVAYWLFHAPHSFYPAVNGGDAAILFCFVFLYVAVAGPGVLSLDGLRHRFSTGMGFSKA